MNYRGGYDKKDIELKGNKFSTIQNDNVVFKIANCTILSVSDTSIRILSKGLHRVYPLYIALETKHDVNHSCISLTEDGICMNLKNDNVGLQDVLISGKKYDMEFRLYSLTDSTLVFKVQRVMNSFNDEPEVAEPDDLDIKDIKTDILERIKIIHSKSAELFDLKVAHMNLHEIIALEDDLFEFFQNNI